MNDRVSSRSSSDEPSPAEVVGLLGEKPISGLRRAVDMQIFDFGDRVPIVDHRGRNRTIGEYRLHVQSPWRFLRAGVPFVTYHDLWQPTTEAPDAPFDPNLGSETLRDELLERFVAESTADERTVENVSMSGAGGLYLRFRGGTALEVDAEDPQSEREAWRLLLPDGAHAVMSGSRFAMQRPPPS